ncbi:MAG: hypothetical protein IPG72_07800 [Ardenticatenales bacterium]|nr:hypothetical protein [Ardenticatenales bacterium]
MARLPLKRPQPAARAVQDIPVSTRMRDPFAGFGVVALGALVAALGAYVGAGHPLWRPARRAVLIDELAVFAPHPAFVREIGATLDEAGYGMTYVPSQEVTVERLRSVPDDRANLIIVRAHAALIFDRGRWTDDAALFSSEPVDLATFDVSGLRALDPSALDRPSIPAAGAAPVGASQLGAAAAAALIPVRRDVGEDRRPYLGLGARFVRDHLRGRLRSDAVVVLMGCDTLRGRGLSEAFMSRGARAVIGWNREVSSAHTDRATASLVAHYVVHGDVAEAVLAATVAVGPDPKSGAHLVAAMR